MPAPRRTAFTLFEVALSLGLVGVGVVTVIMLFPIGLRQLAKQRFQTYAACVANQLIEANANGDPSSVFSDAEGPGPWDVPIDRRTNAPDLEMRCSNQRFGLMPLPPAIARRLDSDGGEIARILDEGGYVYYLQPNVPSSFRDDLGRISPPNDLQQLIVGVVGYAQHNAAFSFPQKRWPYYGQVPGPPLHVIHCLPTGWDPSDPASKPSGGLGDMVKTEDGSLNNWNTKWGTYHGTYCWAAFADRAGSSGQKLQALFNAFWNYYWMRGNKQGKVDPASTEPEHIPTIIPDSVQAATEWKKALSDYLVAAIDYAAAAGVTSAELTALMDTAPPVAYGYDSLAPNVAAKKVLAINYVMHALMCLTRWTGYDAQPVDPTNPATPDTMQKKANPPQKNFIPLLKDGVDIESVFTVTLALHIGPVTHDRIVNLVRNGRYCYYRFTASNPYNWAVPRPIEHASMMDYPLLELDMFREPAAGSIWGATAAMMAGDRSGGSQAFQWRYMSPTAISCIDANDPIGPGMTYPLMAIPAPDPGASAGAATISENGPQPGNSHLTILNRFNPSERCRELVFWEANWQAYEDCETCPSAPVDASRYPKAAPGGYMPSKTDRGWTTDITPTSGFDDLMWGFTEGWGDVTGLEQYFRFGNGTNNPNPPVGRSLVGNYVHAMRNPEKNLLFIAPVTALPTGSQVTAYRFTDILQNANQSDPSVRPYISMPPDYGPPTAPAWQVPPVPIYPVGTPAAGAAPPVVFCGQYGADRNGNGVLDRGPLPVSVRMRAETVARFNFYDMRVSCQVH